MTRLPKILAPVLLVPLAGLVGAGLWAQSDARETRQALEGQTQIARELLTLRAASGSQDGELAAAVEGALGSLAPAAVEQAEGAASQPLKEQLNSSIGALLDYGLATENHQERAQALITVADVWQAARADGLAGEELPSALTEHLEVLTAQDCARVEQAPPSDTDSQEALPVPASVISLQESYFALNYLSEFYQARAATGYADLAKRTDSLASSSQAYINQLAPAAACYGYTASEEATYPVLPPTEAASQLDQLEDVSRTNARAVLTDPALPHGADTLEALALAAALA